MYVMYTSNMPQLNTTTGTSPWEEDNTIHQESVYMLLYNYTCTVSVSTIVESANCYTKLTAISYPDCVCRLL